jgi:hypothetical protein
MPMALTPKPTTTDRAVIHLVAAVLLTGRCVHDPPGENRCAVGSGVHGAQAAGLLHQPRAERERCGVDRCH